MSGWKTAFLIILILLLPFTVGVFYRGGSNSSTSNLECDFGEELSVMSSTLTYFSHWNYSTTYTISAMAMSADGNYIVVGDSDGSTDGKVYLFNTSNSMPIWMYNASEPVTSVAISANGSTIVVGTSSGLVYLFNESSSQPVWSYDVGMNALVSISDDGFYFVAGNQYDVVHYDEDDIFIFNRTGPTPMWTYKFWYSGGSWVSHIFHDVAISADGNYVTYSADCYLDTFEYQFVFLFDIQGNEIFNTEAAGGEDDPCPIAITDDGSFVTTASYRVNVFDDTPGDFFTKIDLLDYYLGTGSRVNDIAIAANGSYIVAGHGNSRIYLFNNSDSTLIWNYTTGGAVKSIAITDDCSNFIAGSVDDYLYLFHYSTSTPIWNCSMGGDVSIVSISANGSQCAAVTGSKIALFGTENLLEEPILDLISYNPHWDFTTTYSISTMAMSADGNYVVVGDSDGSNGNIYLFNKNSSEPIWNYSTLRITSVAISANGSFILAGNSGGMVFLFTNENSTPIWSYDIGEFVQDLDISADGFYFTVAGEIIYFFSRNESDYLWAWAPIGWSYTYSLSISADGFYVVWSFYWDWHSDLVYSD